ncbi:MAG: glycosyltransferase family 9 protein [Deltaproteobacteria bacterium HGW-Deltaproteobacteria-15]|jgi:ADP-heptose:LPS heptosyltransferase|nr:MAG: glycosyltransferase family 9 protein [Deltaproteobacteria bacterium HGW-Deltaproteobacteria-15]
MGSLVLAKPMFDFIRERYRGAEIYLLLFERNRDLPGVLDGIPNKNVLTLNDRSFRSFLSDSIRIVLRLRLLKIDTVLDCELFSRISSLFSLLSGAKVRAGFHAHTQEGLYRGGFINRRLLYNPYTHISLQFISMVESLGSHGTPLAKRVVENRLPQLSPMRLGSGEKHRFERRLGNDFPHLGDRKMVLVYAGGGLLPIRAWPSSCFIDVARDLICHDYAVGVIGPAEDRYLGERIASACEDKRCLNLAGYTRTIKELLLLLQRGSLLIANDGGPGHFASLVSIPSIVLYGPETPTLYGVLGENAYCFYSPLSCSPCLTAYNHRKSPCDGNNICLKQIPPEDVLNKAYEVLTKRTSGRQTGSMNVVTSS